MMDDLVNFAAVDRNETKRLLLEIQQVKPTLHPGSVAARAADLVIYFAEVSLTQRDELAQATADRDAWRANAEQLAEALQAARGYLRGIHPGHMSGGVLNADVRAPADSALAAHAKQKDGAA